MRPHGAYILARYSTDNQNADTIETQVGKCSEWCAAHSLPVLGVYADYAVSGMKDTRPQYEAMMAALRSGGADTVVIYDQSRMFRLMTAWFEFRQELEKMGVRVVSVTQPLIGGDLSDPAVFANEGIAALFNQMWVLQTTQKVNAAKQRKAKLGEHNGGKPPLGYRVEDKRLVIDDREAAVVRRIFNEYAGGRSYKTIIDGLNRDGLTTKTGKPFGSNSLHDLLKNEKYTGVMIYGGKKYRPDGTRNTHAAQASDAIRVENAVPPIISRELFEQVQHRLDLNRRQQGGRPPRNRDYHLKGKVFCGLCGSAMCVNISRRTHYYYVCGKKKRLKTDCDNPSISVDNLEDLVLSTVRQILGAPKAYDSLAKILAEFAAAHQSTAVDRLKELQARETALIRKLDNATDAILEGLSSPALKNKIADLESQLRATRQDLRTLRRQTEAIATVPAQALNTTLHAALNTPAALFSIVTRVEIYPDTIHIYTILDPDPTTQHPTYDSSIPSAPVTITPGPPSGVPTIIVTPYFLKFVVAR